MDTSNYGIQTLRERIARKYESGNNVAYDSDEG